MNLRQLALSAALILVPAALYAQTAPPPAPAVPVTGKTIAERKTDQQQRIAQGVQSGQLTAGETRNLEGREQSINRQEHRMRAKDDGHLTGADKRILNHRQNVVSHKIYNKKHNAKKQ